MFKWEKRSCAFYTCTKAKNEKYETKDKRDVCVFVCVALILCCI